MTDDQQRRRGGCGWFSAAALVVLALLSAASSFGLVGVPGLPWGPSDRLQLPAAITRTAEKLGSTVATSAKSFSPLSMEQSGERALRLTRPHIVPTAGKLVEAPAERFFFDGVKYSVTPYVAAEVYWGAKRSTRLLGQLPGESDYIWTNAYYHAFADDPEQQPAIDDVVAQLRAIRDRAHLSPNQYLELIAKYVQSIPYDWSSYGDGTGKQRFPVETLVDDKGLCGDKSVLLADLLAHEGYAVALLDFGPEKHMAVGVLGAGKTYASAGYLFLETTAPCYVSDVPTEYTGGMQLHSDPTVVRIDSGTIEYSAADEIAKIVAVRESAQRAADRLYKAAKGENLTYAQARAINRKLDQAYRAETSLRSNVVDHAGKSVGIFMDRTAALTWIDRNCWWL